ncbi:MAG: radical SAM protein [Deltaproteobacteria bacterium]|nr:radical SAM protein [Deltaproteobacteria bacterium]
MSDGVVGERVTQIAGHVRQAMLFRRLFDPATMLMDVVRFPVDRYLRDGRASWPTSISLVIRSECNVRCVMCHSEEILDSRERFMSLTELQRFIEHLGPRGRRPSLFLTGGEPFMRKDILDVIALIKAEGMPCGVVTNGTLLSVERIRRLVELDIDCVVLSLHGPEAVHDAITQRPGSYAKLTEAARELLARRRGTRVLLNCAITEHNADALGEVVAEGERLGVDAVRFEHLNFVTPEEMEAQAAVWERLGDPAASVNSYVHRPGGGPDLAASVAALERRPSRIPVFVKPNLDASERDAWYSADGEQKRHCTYPWRSLFVSAGGDVYPCLFMFYKVGNLLEEPLEAIWNGDRMVRFRKEVGTALFPACARCCKL